MYYDYFGLKQPPFRITPDTSLFYPGGDRGAVLDALIYAILNGEGMVKVVGEVGSGKTMLCRMLELELPDKVEVVYLANPSLSPENILHAIAFELKLPVQPDTSRLQVMHNLQEFLLQRHAENRQVVVFVEEAQAMPIATLEEIRLLSNLETEKSKLLQIVLFGQPELDELLAMAEIRQLKERITYSFQLNPFMSEHIRDYLNTRLRASGYRAGEVFDKGAIRKIEHYSKGLLRRVNILADKSLLAAYAANTNQVTASHVVQAARDSEFVSKQRRLLWASLITASILLGFVAILGIWPLIDVEGSLAGEAQDQSPRKTIVMKSRDIDASLQDKLAFADKEMSVSVNSLTLPDSEESKVVNSNPGNKQIKTKAYETVEESLQSSPAEALIEILPGESTTLNDAEPEPEPRSLEVSTKSALASEAGDADFDARVEGQLLDLTILFELQDLGDVRLSTQESEMLRRQLKELPPEVALYQDSAQFSDICKLCWSILYRPVAEPENL